MISKLTFFNIMQKILRNIEEGIHVIDNDGITIIYNNEMSVLEGMDANKVIGKSILDVFPTLNNETSTLLHVLKTEKPIKNRMQTYVNILGKEITTLNTTIPLYEDNKKIGALEIAKNITKIKSLSDEIYSLQNIINKKEDGLNKKRKKTYIFDDIIGSHHKLNKSIKIARKASKTNSSVLIYGKTGTGKEMIAQSIHNESSRNKKPFIAQNCAALPETLLESLLFGTTKGSFTGAIDKPGIFEQANGGTILLDEINSMNITLQAKLLRVLQENYIRRIGGNKDIPIDVRIIATTNEDPEFLIDNNIIRKDLYYRLNVIYIELPELKNRNIDIDNFVEYFIDKYNKSLKKDVWMISDSVKNIFYEYSWPGNIRELENVIESSMNFMDDEHIIKKSDLPNYILKNINYNKNKSEYVDIANINDLSLELDNIEKDIISKKLYEHHYNITKTANSLNLSRQSLQYKIKKYNIKF